MRYQPPVIYWVEHHRGPAGYAGLGCTYKTVQFWLASPPVQSQKGGVKNNQTCYVKKTTPGQQ